MITLVNSENTKQPLLGRFVNFHGNDEGEQPENAIET
jgi:hypothetical protein